MNLQDFLFTFTTAFLAVTDALKCKCTQSSARSPCDAGICEVPAGSSACLMIDHPASGRHYACSTASMEHGECIDKMTKSGTTAKVCACDTTDFCNFKMWPSLEDFSSEEHPRKQTSTPKPTTESSKEESHTTATTVPSSKAKLVGQKKALSQSQIQECQVLATEYVRICSKAPSGSVAIETKQFCDMYSQQCL
ncbi:Protein Y45F3A.4 [Aphelenchoides avenae]|nr:Protein Y45F3A.4 [Aphelenchus avenae]